MPLRAFITQSQQDWQKPERLERQLRDYVDVTTNLIWQRQAIFLAATLLTAFYFNATTAVITYSGVLCSEVLDLIVARRMKRWKGSDLRVAYRFLTAILFNTLVSSSAICLFILAVALQQDSGGHFTPLFFLFAAALFAAMNNHQVVPALVLRLLIYGATFTYIALMDILRYYPPIDSQPWLEFFTIIFVMYFIIDCSFIFLKFYRKNVRQMEELIEEHERTKIAYKAKSQFVAIVSHELRTPLTSIKGSLDLISCGMLGPVPEKMQSILSIAAKNSERLADLINDILDLQKIEAGEISYRFAPVDVSELISDAIEANRGFADKLKIDLAAEFDRKLDLVVRGDEKRLMQVMTNMISNALKFSHEGGKVTVSYAANGDKIRLMVKDRGVGIPENSEDKVFGKFTQVDSTDERGVGGTGLGMNISKKIVEHHNGTIGYDSKLGVGTTFYIDLDQWDQSMAA